MAAMQSGITGNFILAVGKTVEGGQHEIGRRTEQFRLFG